MKVSYKGLCIGVMLASLLGLAACKQDGPAGPAEKAGQKIDKAVDQAGKKIDQATEEAGKKIEKAGQTLSDTSKKTGVYMDDAAITAKIKAEIASDPLLKVSEITVTTTNGMVKLTGLVDSSQSIDRALEITRSIKDVKSTENGLVVKSVK